MILTWSVTTHAVCAAVAQHTGIDADTILSRTRRRGVSRARQIAVAVLAELTPWSFHQIGRSLSVDHSTAMYSRKRILELRRADPAIDKLYRDVRGTARQALAQIPYDIDPPAHTVAGARTLAVRVTDRLRHRLHALADRDPVELVARLTELVVGMENAIAHRAEQHAARMTALAQPGEAPCAS